MNLSVTISTLPAMAYVASAFSIGFVVGWLWNWLTFMRSGGEHHER